MTNMSDDRPAWLAPLNDARNEEILAAAFDLFVEKGIQGATMLEIATRAKVSKETLYARFDSKEGLFYALLAWGSRHSALDETRWADEAIADPVAALRDYAVDCLSKMMQPESIEAQRIVIAEANRLPEVARVFNEFTCDVGMRLTARFAEALNAQGLAEIDDVVAFGHDCIGLLRGNLYHEVMLGLEPAPDAETVKTFALRAVDRLLRAYAPRARSRAAA